MIGFRQSNNPRRLERCGFQALCSFDLYWKSSGENPERLLKSSGISVDFLKNIEGNIKDFDFESLRSTLVLSSKANFNENDRLCYIDNDNDEIPIDQQSEFLEALKFAQASCNERQKNVPLIIIKAKEKSEKSPQKIKTTNSSSKNPSDKMPPMKVESTSTCDMTIADSSEHELALRWFHDFLEGFKKEIVADVTKEVLKKMTSAMLLSQNLDTVESPSPETSQACPEIPRNSTKIYDLASRAKINTLYRATLPVKNPQGGTNSKAKSSISVTTKTQLPAGGQVWKENDGQSDYVITRTVLPDTIHYSADKISGSVPGTYCSVLPPGPAKFFHMTESSPGYFPIPMNIDAKQAAPATSILKDEKTEVAKKEVFPLADEKKIKIIEGEDYDITVVAWKDKESEQKMDEFIKSFKEHQNNRNDPSSKEETAGSSGKPPSNENNQDVSEKQPPSDSDNISILSDNSHMSDFIVEDENYEVIQTEEPPKSEEAGETRRESSSSFELVSESPSPIDVNEQQFSPDKKVPKPMIYVHFDQPGTSNAAPRDNAPSPVFAVDTQGKAYTKNIAETPEDGVTDPQLDKRSGGAYSFVTYNLENSKEKIVDSSSSKPTKMTFENFKFYKGDEKPQETFFFANKTTAEQQKPSTEPQAPKPQRRVVFDHNTSKGLGDTKQTSPKKRSTNKTGETHRGQTFTQSNHGQHQYFHPRPQHCFFQTHGQFPETPGNFENWAHCYSGQAPIPQPWQTGYPYPDTMQILPETLISGAVHAASSAYTTARKVIEKIRSPQPGAPARRKPRKM